MIFPAIDLKNGQSVRLYQGDFSKDTLIETTPEKQAQKINAAGISALHLVDLDGAKAGKPQNLEVVKKIRDSFSGIIEIGGGIRNIAALQQYLEMGINRVILGSVALKNPEFTKKALQEFGAEKIVIGVDGTDSKVAVSGWLEQSNVLMSELIEKMIISGAKHFIVTDVKRDGTLQGANVELLIKLQTLFPQANIIASGGIRDLRDITELRSKGIKDAIVGKSLFEGTLTLKEIAEVNTIVS